MRTLVAVALVLLVACSGPAEPATHATRVVGGSAAPSQHGAVSPSAEPSRSGEPSPSRWTEKVYVEPPEGSRVHEVRRDLAQLGLVVRTVRRATCLVPPGVVVSQDSPAGSWVRPGVVVRLTVAATPAAATCVWNGAARDAVRRLHAWARGRAGAPAFAEEVRVLQGNHVALRLTADEAADPGAWTMPGGYADRVPLNPVGWLAGHTRLVPRDVPPYFCPVRGDGMPLDLLRRLATSRTLVTTGAESCMEVGAVQVWADERGRIEAVNLLLGSP